MLLSVVVLFFHSRETCPKALPPTETLVTYPTRNAAVEGRPCADGFAVRCSCGEGLATLQRTGLVQTIGCLTPRSRSRILPVRTFRRIRTAPLRAMVCRKPGNNGVGVTGRGLPGRGCIRPKPFGVLSCTEM